MSKRRSRKRYNDQFGKNRPLKANQVRCETAWCNAAVHVKVVKYDDNGKRKCPNCFGETFIRKVTKEWEIVISKHDIDQRA